MAQIRATPPEALETKVIFQKEHVIIFRKRTNANSKIFTSQVNHYMSHISRIQKSIRGLN